MTTITQEDIENLKSAKLLLENPGFAAKITNYIGKPIEAGIKKLPKNWSEKVGRITYEALETASKAAIFTMKDNPGQKSLNRLHLAGVAISGAVGGFFSVPGLIIELPISTTIMLRTIADIARSHGESIEDVQTRFACLEVFTMGGKTTSDDSVESGYFAARTLMARSISEASKFILENGLVEEGMPLLLKVLMNVASRFSIQVTEKAAAQAIPIFGALGGATINTMFINHFQNMAKGHFMVRKLERKYGSEIVKELYYKLPTTLN
jgi:hypothetical protein